jgi:DNA-binding SARP family transcriptional activator
MIRFSVLGPVRVWRSETELDVGPRQQHLILALLAVRAGRPVAMTELVELLWGDEPPASAVNIVHRYVGLLRRLLEPGLPTRSSGHWILRDGNGYRVVVDSSSLDLLAARRFAADARRTADRGDSAGAVRMFAQALDLWKGGCGAGLGPAAQMHPAFVAVDREASATARDAADTALHSGQAALILPALRQATDRDPLDEALQARLLLCLAADGKQAEALHTYDVVRRRLTEELGVDPGRELTAAHLDVLRQHIGSEGPNGRTVPADQPWSTPEQPSAGGDTRGGLGPLQQASLVTPAQLPQDLPLFAGRHEELKSLDESLISASEGSQTTLTVAIDGMPGVGKSALAVRWAHRAKEHFPDGQLFLNLRGFDARDQPMRQAEALRTLLSGLGVPHHQIPGDFDAKAGLYRSLLAGRRVLVVLDNARDARQAEPLLPGTPGSAAVITSRTRLTGLAVQGARILTVGLPLIDDARENMLARVGARRAAAEPAALDAIIDQCARLPLAMAVVGARAASHPEFSLASIATELRDTQDTLESFAADDAHSDIRTIFFWSYRLLTPPAGRLFRLLSLPHGQYISLPAAASLAGVPSPTARALLGELTRSRMLVEQLPGHYVFHDLIQAYALELLASIDSEDEQSNALTRLIAHYQHTAQVAQRWLDPSVDSAEPSPLLDGVTPEVIGDYETAIRTLAAVSSAVAAQVRRSGS